MYFSQKATYLTGFVLMVFLCYVIAFEDNEDQTLKLKLGFDLTQGTNGVPSLRIRNYEDSSKSRKVNSYRENVKRSVRADSSSGSDDVEENKEADEAVKAVGDTDVSDDVESSGSDGDRQFSTKGLNPEEFEPESRVEKHKPKIREKDNEEDSE